MSGAGSRDESRNASQPDAAADTQADPNRNPENNGAKAAAQADQNGAKAAAQADQNGAKAAAQADQNGAKAAAQADQNGADASGQADQNGADAREQRDNRGADAGEWSKGAEVTPGESGGSDIRVRFAGGTAVGLVREHNEDNLVNANLTTGKLHPRNQTCTDSVGQWGSLFAVCDGMGGAAAGEVASQMAVDIIYDAMRRGGAPADRDELARRLVAAVEEAGRLIYETAQADTTRRGMGTTVTAAVLVDKVIFFAQVGDSRAYLLRGATLKQLTKDQSLVSQLIEAGHLTEDEAESFEHSNIILQALGTSETVQVDLSFAELRKGDRLMMCSDGLSGMVDAAAIQQRLLEIDDPTKCCQNLIEEANAAGGHDNITVIVADFEGDSLAEPEAMDAFGYVQYPLPLAEADQGIAQGAMQTVPDRPAVLHPSAQETPRKSYHWWLVGGMAALVAAGAALALSSPKPTSESAAAADAHKVRPAGEDTDFGEPKDEPSGSGQPPESKDLVQVRVHSDVENAELLVNGEPKGSLSTAMDRTIELLPGAYRFEAQSGGSTAAVVVATVRPGTPLEVSLSLPSGAGAASGLEEDRAKPVAKTEKRQRVPRERRSRRLRDVARAQESAETAEEPGPGVRRPRRPSPTGPRAAAEPAPETETTPGPSAPRPSTEDRAQPEPEEAQPPREPARPRPAPPEDTEPEPPEPGKTEGPAETPRPPTDIPENPF